MNTKFFQTVAGAALGAAILLTPVLAEEAPPRRERVLTQAEQDALTPESVLKTLQEGNQRFVAGTITKRDHSAMVRQAVSGQYPKAVILSCLDSRRHFRGSSCRKFREHRHSRKYGIRMRRGGRQGHSGPGPRKLRGRRGNHRQRRTWKPHRHAPEYSPCGQCVH